MAVVRTFKLKSGVTVHECDDAYRDLTPEQIEQRKKDIEERLKAIAINSMRRNAM